MNNTHWVGKYLWRPREGYWTIGEMLLRGLLLIFAGLLIEVAPVRAVILYGTDDPTVNTTAPTGTLANSGWQFEGQFGSFLGTAIASNYFISAKHIGGNVGDSFIFNNVSYTTTAKSDDPSSDLRVWRIAGTLPFYAPLYSSAPGSEVNLGLIVFGRGTRRGGAVLVGNDSHLGGWGWGAVDGVQRWGTNVVGSIVDDPTYGKLLRVPFNNNVGPDEAHISIYDSGGGVFIFNPVTNRWELAGISFEVDGPFSTSSTGAHPFDAAMFDTTGLFVNAGSGPWTPAPNPSAFYPTEIASHRPFIESVVMRLVRVVSRKTHGNAGPLDVALPLTGPPGIECRSGGSTNAYTLVFTFTNNVTVQNASVTAGAGTVTNFTAVGKVVTVDLIGVINSQTITVTLASVSDGVNTSDVEAAMGVLIGDTNGDGFVDAIDTGQTKAQAGNPVGASNCREDVNVDGFIDGVDTAFVKSKSGSALARTSAINSAAQTVNIHPLGTTPTEADQRIRRPEGRANGSPNKLSGPSQL